MQQLFDALKTALLITPVLGYPDPQQPCISDTNAIAHGIGVLLSQDQGGREKVIAYYSKTLSPANRNHCVTHRELLVVVKGMKHFRPCLYDCELS